MQKDDEIILRIGHIFKTEARRLRKTLENSGMDKLNAGRETLRIIVEALERHLHLSPPPSSIKQTFSLPTGLSTPASKSPPPETPVEEKAFDIQRDLSAPADSSTASTLATFANTLTEALKKNPLNLRACDFSLDLPGMLHQELLPLDARRRQGAFYTPPWLAAYVLEELRFGKDRDDVFLDPACGSGVFLIEALRRYHFFNKSSNPLEIIRHVQGIEIQPMAHRMARINCRLFLGPELEVSDLDQALIQTDVLELGPALQRRISHVGTNPPWIGWEYLGKAQRHRILSVAEPLGLMPHKGWETRMGAGKKDLSYLFVALAATQWLSEGGRMAFVLPRTILAGAAARGLRTMGAGHPYRVEQIDDLGHLKIFRGTGQSAVLLFGRVEALREGGEHKKAFHAPLFGWRGRGRIPFDASLSEVLAAHSREKNPCTIDSKGSAWLPSSNLKSVERGEEAYQAYEGSNTGGANGVFWIKLDRICGRQARIRNCPELGRKALKVKSASVELDFLYSLLRGRDVSKWRTTQRYHILLVQDPQKRQGYPEEWLSAHAPRTLDFLLEFRSMLENRPLYRRFFKEKNAPWYSIYNVGPYTMSPHKVVFREQAREMTAAVIGPAQNGAPIIPDHKLMLIPTKTADEAHFLCALLNSPPAEQRAKAATLTTSRSPKLLKHLGIPKYDPKNAVHRALSRLSKRAHYQASLGNTPLSGDEMKRLSRLSSVLIH